MLLNNEKGGVVFFFGLFILTLGSGVVVNQLGKYNESKQPLRPTEALEVTDSDVENLQEVSCKEVVDSLKEMSNSPLLKDVYCKDDQLVLPEGVSFDELSKNLVSSIVTNYKASYARIYLEMKNRVQSCNKETCLTILKTMQLTIAVLQPGEEASEIIIGTIFTEGDVLNSPVSEDLKEAIETLFPGSREKYDFLN